jgi:hypothetical protein
LLSFFQGKLKEALKLFEQALRIYEDTLGGSHPKVVESLRNIAKVHLDMVSKGDHKFHPINNIKTN